MANSPLETQHRKLIAEIETALDDPGGAARLASHLKDLPRLLQDMEEGRGGDGQMVMLVDVTGHIVSQNAAAARKLGLRLGASIQDVALTPEAASQFLAAQRAPDAGAVQAPVTLAIAAPTGATVFLLGHQTEPGGPVILSEVQRGVAPDVRARLAAAIGLIPSEAQLLDGLLQGRPVDQIAAELGRKEGTTRQQVKSIMAKMGVHSQSQLVSTVYALSLMYQRNLAGQPAPPTTRTAHHGAELFDGASGTVGLHSFGPDTGLPVLLLHGALFGIAAFAPMRMAAETLGLRLIAPERPGFGHTLFPEDGDAVALCCAQIIDLLDQLGVARVIVVAHDIGTRFAARLALRAPDRVAAVIAAPATPPMQTWAQTADMPTRHRVNAWAAQHMPGLMDKIVALGLKQIARNGIEVIPRLVFDGCDFDQAVLARAEAGEALQEGFHLAWAQRGVGFRADMRLTNENWQDEARRITVPFLCLHGENSRTVSRNAVENLAAVIPQGRFRLVVDAGHSLPLSHPALLLRAAVAAGHSAGMGLDNFGF